jgi:DNA primase
MNMRNPDKPDNKPDNKTTKPKKSRLGKLTLQKDIFDTALKDNLKSTVDIVALFSHFGVQLTKKGKSHVGLCPWHDDSTPSLSVDKTKGLYNCFGCGESGDIFTLVEKMKGCTFSEAMEFLQQQSGLSFSQEKRSADELVPSVVEGKAPPEKATQVVAESPSQKKASVKAEEKTENTPSGLRPSVARGIFAEQKPASGPPTIGEEKEGVTYITLDTIRDQYSITLQTNQKAQEYLKSRGISIETAVKFKIGYVDGSIRKKAGGDAIAYLKETGILTQQGNEHFNGCIVVPLTDVDNKTLSFYGRKVDPGGKIQHLYLPGEHKAIFNEKAFQVYDSIILTESVIDALSLIIIGIQNVSCIYGTQGLTKLHIAKLHEHAIREVILALDNDTAGKEATEKYTQVLVNEGFAVKTIKPHTPSDLRPSPPTTGGEFKDWNESLVDGFLEKEEVLSSIKEAEAVKPEPTGRSFRKTDSGLVLIHNELEYTVKSENASYRQSIKCVFGDDVYYDRVDLFSARSRSGFANSIAKLFDIPSKQVEKDLIALLEYLEDAKQEQQEAEEIVLTEEDKALGLSFLQNPKLFDEIIADTETLGYVGEETNKKLMYLAATSRLLDDPISILILSESGSGKSYLVDTIKKLMPPEDVIDVTSLSDQALNYMGDLEHKFMSLSEAVHKDVIEHQLREMVSNKELRRLVTKKNDKTGTMRTEQVTVKAIVSLVMSSTNYHVNPENSSRSFIVYADESTEQTKRIFAKQSDNRHVAQNTLKKQKLPDIIRKHHAAQRMLKPYTIDNRFDMSEHFPHSMMRFRRDYDRFLDLIDSVCFLRQYQKEVKEYNGVLYIECDDTDYEIARTLMVQGVLRSGVTELPQGAVLLYETIRSFVRGRAEKAQISSTEVTFCQRDIRDFADFSNMYVKRNLRTLVEYEYIVKSVGRVRGSRAHYRLIKDEEIHALSFHIPSVTELKSKGIKNPEFKVGQSGS